MLTERFEQVPRSIWIIFPKTNIDKVQRLELLRCEAGRRLNMLPPRTSALQVHTQSVGAGQQPQVRSMVRSTGSPDGIMAAHKFNN